LQIPQLSDSQADWNMMGELGEQLTAAIIEIADAQYDQAERDKQTRSKTKEIEAEFQARFNAN
tara:strand:+ start:7067 stop:7255 length:189 start_codon:yes stop_codon:yes gene_type:complete